MKSHFLLDVIYKRPLIKPDSLKKFTVTPSVCPSCHKDAQDEDFIISQKFYNPNNDFMVCVCFINIVTSNSLIR